MPRRRADLLAEGLTDGMLRSTAVRSPHRGVHTPASAPGTLRTRILEAAALLPHGGAVGGWAAAYLLGDRSFDGRTVAGIDVPVLLCVPREARHRPRDGVRFRRADLRPEDVTRVADVPITVGARTAVDLARLHPDGRERVVALDALWASGIADPPGILRYLDGAPPLRGIAAVKGALRLTRRGVLSRQETRLRLVWCLDAGLAEPRINPRVVDRDGRHLGRPDLLDEAAGLVAEFDGRDHLDLRVTTTDNVRQEGLEAHGLVVCRFTGLDLAPGNRLRTVTRLQQAHDRALATSGYRSWRVLD